MDERCVSPDDEESNFKHADEFLFRPLDIPHAHVHRIHGEREPEVEAEHYSELVKWELPGYASCPRFDAIILGIGEDGHTNRVTTMSGIEPAHGPKSKNFYLPRPTLVSIVGSLDIQR